MAVSNDDQGVKTKTPVSSYLNRGTDISITNAANWARLFKAAEPKSPIKDPLNNKAINELNKSIPNLFNTTEISSDLLTENSQEKVSDAPDNKSVVLKAYGS